MKNNNINLYNTSNVWHTSRYIYPHIRLNASVFTSLSIAIYSNFIRLYSNKPSKFNFTLPKDFNLILNNNQLQDIVYLSKFAANNPKLKWVYNKCSITNKKIGVVGDLTKFDLSLENLLLNDNYKNNYSALKDIIDNLDSNCSYAIAFIIRNSYDNTFKVLDKHYLINNTTDTQIILEKISLRIDALSALYNFYMSDTLSVRLRKLNFKVKDPSAISVSNCIRSSDSTFNKIKSSLLSSNIIPHTMNLNNYGECIMKNGNTLLFLYNNYILKVDIIDLGINHIIEVIRQKDSKVIARLEDLMHDNTFIRAFINIDNNEVYLTVQYDFDFNLINLEFEKDVKFITISDTDLIKNDKILTFDIETYLDNNNSIPYACGYYDGKKSQIYYLTDFSDSDSMLYACITDMITKYHNYTVYCHNFAKFDGILIHQLLHKYFDVSNIISKELDIISLTIKSKCVIKRNIKHKLTFKDSYAILPSSLDKLGASFKVDVIKSYFPYEFPNKLNLNYIGDLPDIKYYNSNMTLEIYNEIKINILARSSKNWSMKDETIEYLNKDIISLYQIVIKQVNIIFKNYRVNLLNVNTISGLSVKIYRSNFLLDGYKIPILKGDIEKNIRSAFYGGRTEVIKPIVNDVFCYDCNGLYPTAMLKPLPVGKPIYSLNKDLFKIFGFIRATVIVPPMDIPVLPCRININGELKLVFPIGTWTAWFFSEELKLGAQYGCSIQIHESYIFERGYCFNDYVNTMASIKENSEGAMREIHKLLGNSLFGRMGMNISEDIIKIVSSQEAENIYLTNNVIDNFKLNDNKEYIRYHKKPNIDLCEQSGKNYEDLLLSVDDDNLVNSSIPIAAATASWARIIMYPYLKHSAYTDTDSVFLPEPLDDPLVGKGLGKFKDEYGLIKHAIFPSPKLYYLELASGKIISKKKGFSGSITKLDYIELYNGNAISVIDKRWNRNLQLSSINIIDHKMNIKPKFSKRNQLFSLGKWVKTSPLYVYNGKVMSTALTIIDGASADVVCMEKKKFF